MSVFRPSQPAAAQSAALVRPDPGQLPRRLILAGVLILMVALGVLGLLSLGSLRRLQAVESHLALVNRVQQVVQTLGNELTRKLSGEPLDLESVRSELDGITVDPRLLAEGSADRLTRARTLVSDTDRERDHSLPRALDLLNGVRQSEMRVHTALWTAAEASAQWEMRVAMGLILGAGLSGTGLSIFLRGRLLLPLRDLGRLPSRFASGDSQQVSDGGTDPLFRPLQRTPDGLAFRLASPEDGRDREEAHNRARTLFRQTRVLDRAMCMAAMGELAAELAHELRNPLAGIQLAIRRLRGELADGDRIRRLDLVLTELERIGRLSDQLLEQAEDIPEPAVELDLGLVVEEVLALARYQAKKGVRLESRIPPGLRCRLPEVCLRQALLELMLNAVQAMHGRSGKIRVEAAIRGGRLEIRVVDQGPGFPSRLLETGALAGGWHEGHKCLGLAAARRFARRLLGELRLADLQSGGASATIDLPDSLVAEKRHVRPGA
jgi:two-component system, NtrC family, sensor kinase